MSRSKWPVTAAALLMIPMAAHAARTETVLHSFANLRDGGYPTDALILDAAGNLYGTAATGGDTNNGLVFELKPPAPGKSVWTEKVLYTFQGPKAAVPLAGLVADSSGNLFGTTSLGGVLKYCPPNPSCGTVFELTPPAPGKTAWDTQVIHKFNYVNGVAPPFPLILDASDSL